jgi:hypothetical protein
MDQRLLAIAFFASFVGIPLHSAVAFNIYVPANGMVFAWIAGIAGAHANRRPTTCEKGDLDHVSILSN